MAVFQTDEDVIVILRHDPGSSDIVTADVVLSVTFFDTPSTSYTDEQKIDLAEQWATEREIAFIDNDRREQGEGPDPRFAEDITAQYFTKMTDLWFEPVIMPLIKAQV